MDYVIYQNTLDPVEQVYVPKQINVSIVSIVELIQINESLSAFEEDEKKPRPFVIYHKPDDISFDDDVFDFNAAVRPIVGYAGEGTFPFISNPLSGNYGAVGVFEKRLIYSPVGIPLHTMRDSYRHILQSPDENRFWTNATFRLIIEEFLDSGYPLFFSPDMKVYDLSVRFSLGAQLPSLDQII